MSTVFLEELCIFHFLQNKMFDKNNLCYLVLWEIKDPVSQVMFSGNWTSFKMLKTLNLSSWKASSGLTPWWLHRFYNPATPSQPVRTDENIYMTSPVVTEQHVMTENLHRQKNSMVVELNPHCWLKVLMFQTVLLYLDFFNIVIHPVLCNYSTKYRIISLIFMYIKYKI